MRRLTAAGWFWLSYFMLLCLVALWLGGCETQPPTHNEYGGYIPACGDKPPLLGDDC